MAPSLPRSYIKSNIKINNAKSSKIFCLSASHAGVWCRAGNRTIDELNLISVSTSAQADASSGFVSLQEGLYKASPVRERVAQLLPEPGITVFEVGIGLYVVVYGDTHLLLKFIAYLDTGSKNRAMQSL